MSNNFLSQYLEDIFKTYKSGKTTEPSFYPDLKKLLEAFLTSKGVAPRVTIEERKTKSGKPDFVVRKGRGELVGYVEAKDISVEDLRTVQNTDQIKRYKTLPNFILTNYFDFWLWREGSWIKKVRIGMPGVLRRVKVAPPLQKEDQFLKLLDLFFSYYIPERKSAKTLAKELADRAKLMPGFIIHELTNDETDEIDRIYEAFKDYLITDLTKEDFADIYAQTITYGLFTARLRYQKKKGFDRFVASQYIPKNIQILHDTFSLISSTALPESITWIVDDIATVLAHANIEAIKEELRTKRGADDPLIHFYETFLAEYDPKKRKSRGVYYTPLPVVSFITRSINILLKEKFGVKEGFADKNVTLLDPASGTLTFPANAIRLAIDEYSKRWGSGGIKTLIRGHVLKNYYAFELLMAPYVIGHLKISLLLQDLGYEFNINKKTDRFKLYLTNTLDFDPVKESNLPFAFALSKEAKKAEKVKKEEKILVILGNPPYSVSSQNDTVFTRKEMELYKEDLKDKNGKLTEKNIQPLSDDYIKFIRFAHWKIDQAGQGIIGMITNNSYLSGLIHRGMRKKLAEAFEKIYILNLHGHTAVGEKTPNGKKDENIFDIRQGVSISLFVKTGKKKNKLANVYYYDLYGLRGDINKKETKYFFLWNFDKRSVKWQKIKLSDPQYFFVPKAIDTRYLSFLSMTQIFSKYGAGVVTGRDKFLSDINKQSLRARILTVLNPGEDNETLASQYDLNNSAGQKILLKRQSLAFNKDRIKSYHYRPLDFRYVYYQPEILERARQDMIVNLFQENVSIVTARVSAKTDFNNAIVTDLIPDYKLAESTRGSYIFPLFAYQTDDQQELLENKVSSSNLSEEFWDYLEKQNHFLYPGGDPWDIFYYIYAVLYSNTYREKYSDFLKSDFPHIPFPNDGDVFYKLSRLGKELVDLHLLKSPELDNTIVKFQGRDGNRVEKREYNEKEKRIYINESQYFERIKKEVWEYLIGGYQIFDKWLKDREVKKLNRGLDDQQVRHYCKIATAITKTIVIQKLIDILYPKVEKNLI